MIKRERVTWMRWDSRRLKNVISHPYMWAHTDEEGYVHYFDTRAEAEAYAAGVTA